MTNKRPLPAAEPEAAVDARRRRLDASQIEPPQNDPPQNDPPQNDPPQNDPPQNDPPQNDTPQKAPPQNDLPQNAHPQNAHPQYAHPQNLHPQNAYPQNPPPHFNPGNAQPPMILTLQGPASAMPLYHVSLGEAISLLSPDQVVENLSLHAIQHPPFRDLLQRTYAAELDRRRQLITPPASRSDDAPQGVRRQVRRPTVYRFDGVITELQTRFNSSLQEENGAHQITAAEYIVSSIEQSVESMLEKALAEDAPLQTRENAIVAMVLIAEIVATCEDTVGKETRGKFEDEGDENSFTQAFVDIAKSFSEVERRHILKNVIEEGEWSGPTLEDKLEVAIELCDEHGVFPDLYIGLKILKGEWIDESEADSGNDDESDG
ncbi:hypothetical protein HDK77DRAFT_258018 [Phyllosticta capitalensis]